MSETIEVKDFDSMEEVKNENNTKERKIKLSPNTFSKVKKWFYERRLKNIKIELDNKSITMHDKIDDMLAKIYLGRKAKQIEKLKDKIAMIDNPDYENCESLKSRAIKLRDEMYNNLIDSCYRHNTFNKTKYKMKKVSPKVVDKIFAEDEVNEQTISEALSGFSDNNEEVQNVEKDNNVENNTSQETEEKVEENKPVESEENIVTEETVSKNEEENISDSRYELKKNEIVQDLPLDYMGNQTFNAIGMTDAEIKQSQNLLNESLPNIENEKEDNKSETTEEVIYKDNKPIEDGEYLIGNIKLTVQDGKYTYETINENINDLTPLEEGKYTVREEEKQETTDIAKESTALAVVPEEKDYFKDLFNTKENVAEEQEEKNPNRFQMELEELKNQRELALEKRKMSELKKQNAEKNAKEAEEKAKVAEENFENWIKQNKERINNIKAETEKFDQEADDINKKADEKNAYAEEIIKMMEESDFSIDNEEKGITK